MADQRVQRRLAAILAADMVGYSRLMGGDEEGTVERLGGRIFKATGDGALAEFASAVERYLNCRDGDYVETVKSGLRQAGLPE